jgi:hypothetical protein
MPSSVESIAETLGLKTEELSETDTFEDFAKADYLETKKEKIEQILKVFG